MNIDISRRIASARGLRQDDQDLVLELVETWREKTLRNKLRHAYYTMHQKPMELGISVPPNLRNLEQVVGWPAKAVDILANRSQFEGFVAREESVQDELNAIVSANRMRTSYRRACKSELELSCSFATVTADPANKTPVVRMYPATSAAATWDRAANGIKAGLVVVQLDSRRGYTTNPVWLDAFTPTDVIRIARSPGRPWTAEYLPHSMGRPLMEPLAYEASLERPFGKSRISRAVMNITDDAMRASVRSEVAGEFFTSPQKYLLGVDGDPFEVEEKQTDKEGNTKTVTRHLSKWDAYIGNIFTVSKDEDGDVPTFGQLSQGSMQPHTEYMRNLAARFSGETNVPLSTLGIIHDNPSSAEAIYAAKEELIIEAQNLNADNGDALRNIALMALAVSHGTDFATEAKEARGIEARFKNPAMPSLVSQADAAIKIANVAPWFAETDVFLEELGFNADQILRLGDARRRHHTNQLVQAAAAPVAGESIVEMAARAGAARSLGEQ